MEFFSTGYTADALLASVGTGAQTLVADLGPIVAVVGGIILAFIGIKFIVSLVKKAGSK